jgi:hypothetical protein
MATWALTEKDLELTDTANADGGTELGSARSAGDVELEEEEEEEEEEESRVPALDVDLAFCTHVGWDGALLLFFSFGIAGTFAWLTFRYTKTFVVWGRPLVWVFPVLATLYLCRTLQLLCGWKRAAKKHTMRLLYKGKGGGKKKRKRGVCVPVAALLSFKQKFKSNGVFFLWKLYLLEFVESVNQIINLMGVYLCTMPVQVTICFCVALAMDSFYRAHQLKQPNSSFRRNRQMKMDLVVDTASLAVPLFVLYFVFDIPISIGEMLQIVLWPSLCAFTKVRSILRDIIRNSSEEAVTKVQKKMSFRMDRRRRSLYGATNDEILSKRQLAAIPRSLSVFFYWYSVAYGLFLLVVASAHLGMSVTMENVLDCDEKTWKTGCKSKIPFCKSLFKPTCNCAVMRIENDYNLTVLPDSLPLTMTGLRKVRIYNCSLTTLPPDMEQLAHMTKFEVVFNHLQTFDVDVRKWERLNVLYLDYNNISTYNEEAVWTHGHLDALGLADNSVKMPDVRMSMPSLAFLHLGENNMNIDAPFDKESFPSLVYLYLNGNSLQTFPSQSLGDNLVFLGVARCDLTSLPTYLSGFKLLKYLDARDNNITAVSEGIKHLIKTNSMESYFSGNDRLCASDTSLDCQPLCSNVCYSRLASGNGQCDISCNSAGACKYDSGECK